MGINYIPKATTEFKEIIPKNQVYKNFRESIEKLISLGHSPIILLQPPEPAIDVAKRMTRLTLNSNYFSDEFDAIPTTDIDQEVRDVLKGLDVVFIDMNTKMCKGDKCITFNKNGGLYNGGSHLSYFGAQLFIDDIMKSLK